MLTTKQRLMNRQDMIMQYVANNSIQGKSMTDIARDVARAYHLAYSDGLRRYVSMVINNNGKHKDNNVLIIGDLHAPFVKNGYFDFCKEVKDKYSCNEIVFIGDIIDNHYSSFHDTDPDGHGAAAELEKAISEVKKWYGEFPIAKVCMGNHDLIPDRKAFSSGLSKRWIKGIGEVLEVPNWEFKEEFIIDRVRYTHGTGRKARMRAKDDLISTVQGHYHSEGYVEHFVGQFYRIFAMQVGCGVDREAYAMAYGRHFKKMHISCGVVLNNGELPILEYMKL